MAPRVLVIWVLALLTMWVGVYGYFSYHFSGIEFEKRRVASLQETLHKRDRMLAKVQLHFNEYKDAIVAAGIKIDGRNPWHDPKRVVASVISEPSLKEIPLADSGKLVFDKARKLYLANDYIRTSEILQDFVRQYPESPSMPQATYLLSEAYFQLERMEHSVRAIDLIITHYPETEYAAYAMLRLAQVYERQERVEEAAEVYETIKIHYGHSLAASIAAKNQKELNL